MVHFQDIMCACEILPLFRLFGISMLMFPLGKYHSMDKWETNCTSGVILDLVSTDYLNHHSD